ncbi:DUF3313 domain-containing protein [Herbaspirillum sp. C7C8]|jgi:hypothetical protein|uniref:DUF3313 domain-containing protein n=1 Tax=Herbaspirillum sp. C7C8 TaxID=2736665 RepID=UPI001F517D9E|nr:DUF3313 domain-containing protein [Herbaspirillum sp. C7C8]MCI1006081.1 DUF3313 domain-containing protein [Herbaspirillum sp. C7C8]
MRSSHTVKRLCFVALVCAILTACASSDPVKYTGIDSSKVLTANEGDSTGRVPFSYSQAVDWTSYEAAVLPPVTIYRGADNQFGSMSEEDKATLANYMQQKFAEELRSRFSLSNAGTRKTLLIKLTLTGAQTNTAVISTFTRFDIGGGLYNAVQNARDREALVGGSIIYSVEVYDASDKRLLKAYITKQYPKPWDIGASMGALSASKAGIDKGAKALLVQLR